MGMFRLMGVFAIIPTTMLLTVSFFVLFTSRKIESSGLKAFGWVVIALLWLGALLTFSMGVYTISTVRHPMMKFMHEMKEYRMYGNQKCDMQGQKVMPPQK